MGILSLQADSPLINEEIKEIWQHIAINEISIFGSNGIGEDIFLELALDNNTASLNTISHFEYLSVDEIHVSFIDSYGHFIEMIHPLKQQSTSNLINEGWVKLSDVLFGSKDLHHFSNNDVFIPQIGFSNPFYNSNWYIPKDIIFHGTADQFYFEELKVLINLEESNDSLSMNMPLGDSNPEFKSFEQINYIIPEEIQLNVILENGSDLTLSIPLIEHHTGYKANFDKVQFSNHYIEIQESLANKLLIEEERHKNSLSEEHIENYSDSITIDDIPYESNE